MIGENGPGRPWSLLVAVVLAAAGLSVGFARDRTKFEEAALGEGTTTVLAEHQGVGVHATTREGADRALAAAAGRGAPVRVLWLGNSQLHAINQYVEGESTGPGLAFQHLLGEGVDVTTLSFPNANFQEHYVVYTYVQSRLPGLKVLVLPLVFDDLREGGVRPDLGSMLGEAEVRSSLSTCEIGRRLLSEAVETPTEATNDDVTGLQDTVQERSEVMLTQWLEEHWELWRFRPKARGHFFLGLYQLRNAALGITPQSKRAIRRSTYEPNVAAVRALLGAAKGHGVRVITYIAPLRSDVDPPYVAAEYAAFQEEMQALAAAEGATFVDLGDLVPGELWGQKESTGVSGELELDFMHFKGAGHALLAEAIETKIREELSAAR